jgi:DNA polymerase III subunit epsilon
MREIVLDTETTGLDPKAGHRIVEIGCVELLNLLPTGRVFHCYINPERDMPEEAFRVHGLSIDFLRSHLTFKEVVQDFLEFLGEDAPIIIHNASFDMKFLNFEMEQVKVKCIEPTRIRDTLAMSRKLNPGGRHSLDALCKKYNIDSARRVHHGALLDSELLAEVYLHLNGGRQPELALHKMSDQVNESKLGSEARGVDFAYRTFLPSADEILAHTNLLVEMKKNRW